MEPRELKFSTFSKVKLSIFRCVISFIPFLFICIYLVLSSLIEIFVYFFNFFLSYSAASYQTIWPADTSK